jgi:hypothetical protein
MRHRDFQLPALAMPELLGAIHFKTPCVKEEVFVYYLIGKEPKYLGQKVAIPL